MNIQIERMTLQDLQQIEPNLYEDFDDFWTVSILKEELNNLSKHFYYVAKQEQLILGFCGIFQILDEINIMNIVTRKVNRNSGIGSLLLEKIIEISKTKNCTSITLEVNEKNQAAIALYQKYHFVEVGLRKKYYNNKDNAIIMTLFLNT